MRFHPEQHLRRQSDFRNLREHGQRINLGLFTLWWLHRHDAKPQLRPLVTRPLEDPFEKFSSNFQP